MSAILIDVNRMAGRLRQGHLPNSDARVYLTYVKHYVPGTRAVVGVYVSSLVCQARESQANLPEAVNFHREPLRGARGKERKSVAILSTFNKRASR